MNEPTNPETVAELKAIYDSLLRGLTKEQAVYFLDQELDRLQMLKLRSDLTHEQKLEAARIGRIEFVSAGATRQR